MGTLIRIKSAEEFSEANSLLGNYCRSGIICEAFFPQKLAEC